MDMKDIGWKLDGIANNPSIEPATRQAAAEAAHALRTLVVANNWAPCIEHDAMIAMIRKGAGQS